MGKLYNIGAHGIPGSVRWKLNETLRLKWSAHARAEAASLAMNLGFPATSFDKVYLWNRWEVVEVEVDDAGNIEKFVARRPVDYKWSIVLVIMPDGPGDGFVKTCWGNLVSDNHRTLDISKFSKP